MLRFELLLPLYYNDGNPVEKEKFVETDEELVDVFGATSTDTVIVSGRWVYHSTLYEDKLIRIRVDTEDRSEYRTFFKEYKQSLKRRFVQEDIWITVQQIEVV